VQSRRENAHEHTGSAEAIRHSLRNGFTAYNALSPAIGFFVTVAGGVLTADLTPAPRRQDHTTLPSALATPVKRAVASTAPRSAFVTLRNAPLCGAGCKSYSLIFVSEKQKYFFK
jgi:hypothetical protein